MKVTIELNNGTRVLAKVAENGAFATIQKCPNPACNAEPCRVRGDGVITHDHGYGAQFNTYYVRAIAQCCTDETQIVDIGEMQVQVNTMFGLDEDIAVLEGRPRVYGRDIGFRRRE